MGIYTSTANIMGLHLTPRLEKILSNVQGNKEINKKDLLFLIDEAGRFETINHHVIRGDFKIDDVMLETDYYLHDALKDLFMELVNMYPSKLINSEKYIIDFSMFGSSLNGGNATPKEIYKLLHNPFAEVKLTQKDLNETNPGIKVIGKLSRFNKTHNVDITITAETKKEETVQEIVEAMKVKLNNDIELMKNRLKELDK